MDPNKHNKNSLWRLRSGSTFRSTDGLVSINGGRSTRWGHIYGSTKDYVQPAIDFNKKPMNLQVINLRVPCLNQFVGMRVFDLSIQQLDKIFGAGSRAYNVLEYSCEAKHNWRALSPENRRAAIIWTWAWIYCGGDSYCKELAKSKLGYIRSLKLDEREAHELSEWCTVDRHNELELYLTLRGK